MSSLFNENNTFNFSTINEAIDIFYHSTSLPVFLINDKGECIASTEGHYKFCYAFRRIIKNPNICKRVHLRYNIQPTETKESYIFTCPSFLMHFSAPIIYKGSFKGALVAGPFLMQNDYETILNDLCNRYVISASHRDDLAELIKNITIVTPERVRNLSKFLFILAKNLVTEEDSNTQDKLNEDMILNQQSNISNNSQLKNYENSNISYPYDKEMDLYTRVTLGDTVGATNTLDDLLEHIFKTSSGDLNIIKPRVIELTSILSRAAIRGGATLATILSLNGHFINTLNDINTIKELSDCVHKILGRFIENVFQLSDSKNPEIIRTALNYINDHYMKSISLDDVASHVYLNSSYFSSLFKAQVGEGFSDYLNKVRIREAKKHLRSTRLSVLQVALMVGYESQSYFSKIFKKITQQTPRQFRKADKLS